MDHLFSLFYAKIALIASYVSYWKELTVFHWNKLAKLCIKKNLYSVCEMCFPPHLIKNSGWMYFRYPRNNDAPFMFVGLRPDPSSHNLFLQGLLNRIVCLPYSSSGHVPWENTSEQKPFIFKGNVSQMWCLIISLLLLWVHFYSSEFTSPFKNQGWTFPRFLDNSQPLYLPYKHGSVERALNGLEETGIPTLFSSWTRWSFLLSVRWDSESIIFLSGAILQCFSFSLCITLLMAK